MSQLAKPCRMPSRTNMPIMTGVLAPMARITPISLVRSVTLMERAPINPIPPTMAIITARPSSMGIYWAKKPRPIFRITWAA